MMLVNLFFIVFSVGCAFLFGYNFAMCKICKCMCEVFNSIDCENKEPQFLEGVFFVSDRLKRIVM